MVEAKGERWEKLEVEEDYYKTGFPGHDRVETRKFTQGMWLHAKTPAQDQARQKSTMNRGGAHNISLLA